MSAQRILRATMLVVLAGIGSRNCSGDHGQARNLIILFIKPAPEKPPLRPESLDSSALEPAEQPLGNITRRQLKNHLIPTANQGIYALYAGIVQRSDANGEILLPRRHQEDHITLVITPRVQPIVLHGATVHQVILDPEVKTAVYGFDRVPLKPTSSQLIWQLKPEELLDDGVIPPTAIILLVDPRNIILPAEPQPARPGANLYLPPLTVTDTVEPALSALWFIKISHYFALTDTRRQKAQERYSEVIIT